MAVHANWILCVMFRGQRVLKTSFSLLVSNWWKFLIFFSQRANFSEIPQKISKIPQENSKIHQKISKIHQRFSKNPQKSAKNPHEYLQKSWKIPQKYNSPFLSMSAATLLGPNLVNSEVNFSKMSRAALYWYMSPFHSKPCYSHKGLLHRLQGGLVPSAWFLGFRWLGRVQSSPCVKAAHSKQI